MIARVAQFEGINVAEAARTMDQAEAVVRPMVEALDGYRGFMELLSPGGKSLSITFFDNETNAEAAEPTFDEEMPKKLGDIFGSWEGRRVSVDRYNVLIDDRR